MRIAILGAGRIGRLHAANVRQHADATLACVADIRADAAEALAQQLGCDALSDPASAVARDDVDAIMVCTSTDTHVDMIDLGAAHGRAIFCEKPVDLDLSRVDACLAAVQSAGVPLMVGFNRRFDPHFAALKARVEAGAVGDIELLRITSRDPEPPPVDYVKVSGGLFRDMMIHDLDMARFLLGEEPVSVHATGSCLVDKRIGDAGDVDTAVVVLKTARGAICTIDNSRRAAYGYDQRVEVFGAKGMLQANNPTPTTLVESNAAAVTKDKPPFFFLERYAAAYRAELDAFCALARGDDVTVPGGDDGRRALVLADAAQLSFDEARLVRLEDLS